MKHIVFFGCFLVSQICLAQTDKLYFSGFGELPVKTPDSLLQNWQNAGVIGEKYQAATSLIHFHDEAGNIDSVLFYAVAFLSQLAINPINTASAFRYQADVGLSLGNAYREKGLYSEALRHYLLGIQVGEKLGDKSVIDQHKFGLAHVYFLQKKENDALSLYREILKETGEDNLAQLVHKQLGTLYLSRGDHVNARTYFLQALHYFQQTGQLKNSLEVQLSLGLIAETEGQTDSAFTVYNVVKDMALAHRFFDLYIQSAQRAGDLLIANNDYSNAQIVLSTVYINALQWENMEAQQHALASLQAAHAAMGDYQNAYALSTQYQRVSAEIADRQNKREVNEMEVRYRTAQKEKEILVKEGQLRQERTIKYGLLIGFLVVLVPVIGLMYMYYQKLQAQHRLNASMEEANQQRIKVMLKEKELELLAASVDGEENERSRIAKELHDSIGGNLAAIKMQLSHAGGEHPEEVVRQLDDTYQLVRDLSHNLVPKQFRNTGFTELIETYLGRFDVDGNSCISFQAYPHEEVNGLPTDIKVEVYKIIQELMTNAQKHAQASRIDIQLARVADVLKLIFEDNGRGFLVDKTPVGIGLRNIRERLKAYHGTMHIDSFPQRGTIVDIDIPLKTDTI